MMFRKHYSSLLYLTVINYILVCPLNGADIQNQGDRDALIQIDKDLDTQNIINWYSPDTKSDPGDGGRWNYVTWSDGLESRVIGIGIAGNNFPGETALRTLKGSSNSFRKLKKLKELSLVFNRISSIGELNTLDELLFLRLSRNDLKDVSSIFQAKYIEFLCLNFNDIDNVIGISNLKNLKHLLIRDNNISDISELSKLSELIEIDVGENNLLDLSDISKLANLAILTADNNNISKLDDLRELVFLGTLNLDGNDLANIDGIRNLPRLSTLSVNKNRLPLSQLFPFMSCPNLYLGEQNDVTLPNLAPPLYLYKDYDLRSEYIFNDHKTIFTFYKNNDAAAVSGIDYTIEDGILRFFTPGKYKLNMVNRAIHSKGEIFRVYLDGVIGSKQYINFESEYHNIYGVANPLATINTVEFEVLDTQEDTELDH